MPSQTPPISIDPDIQATIDAGHKIAAIKMVRERYGLGLRDAKQVVDHYVRSEAGATASPTKRSTETPGGTRRPQPVHDDRGNGRFGLWVFMGTLAVATAYWLNSGGE